MLPAVKKFLRAEAGSLTFVDLLVTITVMFIVMIPLLNFFTAYYAAIVRAGHRTTAANLCREKIEAVKARGFSYCLDRLNESPDDIYMEIDERPGALDIFRRETKMGIVNIQLEGNFESVSVIVISVEVAWRESENEQAVTMESYIAKR